MEGSLKDKALWYSKLLAKFLEYEVKIMGMKYRKLKLWVKIKIEEFILSLHGDDDECE